MFSSRGPVSGDLLDALIVQSFSIFTLFLVYFTMLLLWFHSGIAC